MSGTTPRMGIKTWDGSDPFLRSDFNANWQKIDQYPGAFICTSSTRPAWSAANQGQQIFETDTRRLMMWSGTAWREVLNAPPLWYGSLQPAINVPNNTNLAPMTITSIQVNRPGTLALFGSVEGWTNAPENLGYFGRITVDGSDANVGNANFFRWSPVTGVGNSGESSVVPLLGAAVVGVGRHTLGIRVSTLNGSSGTSITLEAMGLLAILCQNQDV